MKVIVCIRYNQNLSLNSDGMVGFTSHVVINFTIWICYAAMAIADVFVRAARSFSGNWNLHGARESKIPFLTGKFLHYLNL
jgi:hypothetical protein